MATFTGTLIPVYLECGTFTLIEFIGSFIGATSVLSAGDGVDPIVTLVSPLGGRLRRTERVVASVTDNVALRSVILMAQFTDGTYEVVHDGSNFAPLYSAASTLLSGVYTLQRAGLGWPSAFVLRVRAIDTSGNIDG